MEFLAVINEETNEWEYYALEIFIPEHIREKGYPIHFICIEGGVVTKDTAFPENVGKHSFIYEDVISKIIPF